MNVPEELIPLIAWWEKDGKKTLMYAGAAVAVCLGIWGFKVWREQVANAAHAAELTPVMSVDAAREQLETHGQENPVFRLKLASALFNRAEEGDFAAALEIYEQFADGRQLPSALVSLPKLGRAECLEALGRYAEAETAYRNLLDNQQGATQAENAKFGLARTLAALDRREEASKLLDEFEKTLAEDDYFGRKRLEQCRDCIAKKLSDAAPEAAPAAPEAAPATPEVAPASATETPAPEPATQPQA